MVIEVLLQLWIKESVPDDAMCLWIQACRHCVVIWKRNARKAGQHVFRRYALSYKFVERRCKVSMQKIGAEAIERDKNSGRSEYMCSIRHQCRGVYNIFRGGQIIYGGEEDDEEDDDEDVYCHSPDKALSVCL